MDDRLAELIRRHGVQLTAHRLAVLRVVDSNPHCTAEDVLTQVRAAIGAISHQGVYDALAIMVAKGLIRRIEPAGSAARFETRVRDNHHHLICRNCGTCEDVDCVVGQGPCLTPSALRGYVVDEAEVVFWGRCPSCQKSIAGSPGD